jgi:hypothetical protein
VVAVIARASKHGAGGAECRPDAPRRRARTDARFGLRLRAVITGGDLAVAGVDQQPDVVLGGPLGRARLKDRRELQHGPQNVEAVQEAVDVALL